MNPIVQREVRTRWRRLFTFVIVFGYAALLACATGWVYAEHMKQAAAQGTSILARTASPGYKLFIQLTWVQVLLWALLAPALTAPSIAGERERGLLQSLHLSTLSAYQIVTGKLLSALAFIALLLLVPLPISALCFQLGGVSPGEFALAFVLHATTAIAGAAFGLTCSASSRRAGTALVTALLFAMMSGGIVLLLRPLFTTNFIGIATTGALLQSLLTILLIKIAIDVLLFTLPETEASYPAYPLPPVPPTISVTTAGSALKSTAARPANVAPFLSTSTASTRAGASLTTAPVGRTELPFAKWLKFANPVLQREVRTRLRWRDNISTEDQFSENRGGHMQLAIFIAIVSVFMLLGGPGFREYIWWFCAVLWMIAVALGSAIMGASSFTREREQGMLQPLLLTPLTPREILFGKLGGSLVVCAYYSMALLPVLLPCLISVSLPHVIATMLVLVAAAWCCTAWGIFFSWFCRHTAIATGGAVSTLLFACLFLPSLNNAFIRSSAGEALRRWHLYPAVRNLLNPHSTLGFFLDGILVVLALFAAGCLMLIIVGIALRPTTLEKESKSFLFTDLTQSLQ
jgi:ABC-type transport system involved in multi-copper enzyme maturation permease subunit